MIIEVNRTGRKIILNGRNEKRYFVIDDLLEEFGYSKIDVLDYKNYEDVKWEGIEFNRLFKKDSIIYRFNHWTGEKIPWGGAEIEEIGREAF